MSVPLEKKTRKLPLGSLNITLNLATIAGLIWLTVTQTAKVTDVFTRLNVSVDQLKEEFQDIDQVVIDLNTKVAVLESKVE